MSSKKKNKLSAYAQSVTNMEMRVVFQSRTADLTNGDRICSPEMVLLNPGDMRILNVRAGSVVLLRCSSSRDKTTESMESAESAEIELVYQAWPSSKTSAGYVTLNRVWWPNFDSSNSKSNYSSITDTPHRPAVISRTVSHLRVEYSNMKVCIRVENELTTGAGIGSSIQLFRDYLRGYICGGAIIRVGQCLGLTWHTLPVMLTIMKVDVDVDGDVDVDTRDEDDDDELDRASFCYRCNANTSLVFQFYDVCRQDSNADHDNDDDVDQAHDNKKNSTSSAACTSSAAYTGTDTDNFSPVSTLSPNQISMPSSSLSFEESLYNAGFGGYVDEALAVVTAARLALSVATGTDTSSSVSKTKTKALQQSTSIIERQLFRAPRGILLHGPSGTGKTILMRSIITLLRSTYDVPKLSVLELPANILLKAYSTNGDAEKHITDIFQEAHMRAPCIIIIDDADVLCRQRTSGGSSGGASSEAQQRLLSCLLTLIDGSALSAQQGVFIMAASRNPGDIDTAMRRPGRLELEVELSVPSPTARVSILKCILHKMGFIFTTTGAKQPQQHSDENDQYHNNLTLENITVAAKNAHGFVAADLLQGVKEAYVSACSRSRFRSSVLPLSSNSNVSVLKQKEAGGDFDLSSVHALDAMSLKDTSTDTGAATGQKLHSQHKQQACLTDSDLLQGLLRITPSTLRESVVEVPTVYWNDIGGMTSVKQSLREVVEWPLLYPHLFKELGIAPPQGVLLYGPPGCSKTLMAKALATESGMNFLSVRGPELLSKWLGESEKAIQTLFRRARSASPCIIFFDEIDALAGKRGSSSAGVSDRVLAQLLSELDGIGSNRSYVNISNSKTNKSVSTCSNAGTVAVGDEEHEPLRVILVAATNRPDMLDTALLRPGRIDRKVYVPPPDDESRTQIFTLELMKMTNSSTKTSVGHVDSNDAGNEDIDMNFLVSNTKGFSGAEVVAITAEAAMLALDEGSDTVHMAHLKQAINSMTPQITKEMLHFYESLQF